MYMHQIGLIVKMAFDNLIGLVWERLPGPILHREHITVIPEVPGQIQRYDLRIDDMNIGSLRVVRVDEYIQDLTIIPPPEPSTREWSDEEKQLVREQDNTAARRMTAGAITSSILAERSTYRQIIEDLHTSVFVW